MKSSNKPTRTSTPIKVGPGLKSAPLAPKETNDNSSPKVGRVYPQPLPIYTKEYTYEMDDPKQRPYSPKDHGFSYTGIDGARDPNDSMIENYDLSPSSRKAKGYAFTYNPPKEASPSPSTPRQLTSDDNTSKDSEERSPSPAKITKTIAAPAAASSPRYARTFRIEAQEFEVQAEI